MHLANHATGAAHLGSVWSACPLFERAIQMLAVGREVPLYHVYSGLRLLRPFGFRVGAYHGAISLNSGERRVSRRLLLHLIRAVIKPLGFARLATS